MYARKLYMLHNRGNVYVFAVAYRVRLALRRVVEETVYKYRSVGRYAYCRAHINL